MIQPRIYTERIAVRITTELRDQLREEIGEAGIAATMRDAALHAIGRGDLVLDRGRDESGHVNRPRGGGGGWCTVGVNVTSKQRAALKAAARASDRALSALLRDSLVAALDLPPVESKPRSDGRAGWPLGKRKSGRPGR